MHPTYTKEFHISSAQVDCADRLKLSQVLHFLQETAGDHSALLGTDRAALLEKGLFWAVIRHRVQIIRLPATGEDITVKTWPMPTTRSAYPRATEAYDRQGTLLFKAVSLWVLMDTESRAMVLPKRSGVTVEGHTEGTELEFPGSLGAMELGGRQERTVRYTDLDVNGHMNNCRYLDWICDLLGHREESPSAFTVCYLSEAREGEKICLGQKAADGLVRIEACRSAEEMSAGHSRVFAAELRF